MWGRIYPHVVLLIFVNIILKASCKGNGSLTFVIDDTGSMTDDISQVRNSVNRISNIVFNEKSSLIGNMVLVTFNDPDATVRTVTESRYTFKRTLDAVSVHDGGDCRELSMKGLLLGLEKSNRDSYIYVFTDASSKDYHDSHYVKQMCQKKQSQIVFVITGRCPDDYNDGSFDVYFDIANACSGQAFVVSKNNVEEVLQTIDATIKGNKTDITRTTVPPHVKKRIPFTIDEYTDYAIVSVSGENVYLDINGPSAQQERIMWNNNGKVVKLSNAKPGTYEAIVQGDTKTSVVIVGRTDFFFTHGFSNQIPKSPSDTSLQPIAESNVHLSISVNDDHHSVEIVSVQILDMNEKPIKNSLPLTKISENFYVTNQFVAPSERFKVAVNGIVKATGKSIQRIGKIPVTPQEPPKKLPDNTRPTVKIAEGKAIEIEYNSTVKLTCKVVAFPEPKIQWANKRGSVMPSKMSLVEYPYDYISYMDISNASEGDTYKCYATNDFGRDETTIRVTVKDPITVKSAPSGITKLVYGKEGTITCDVKSHLPMDIHWYYANEITGQTREIVTSDKYELSASRTQLKIKMMDFDLVGRYTCKVSLKNEKEVQKSFQTRVNIDGLQLPKLSGVATKNVKMGTLAIIECMIVEGVPKPNITWQYMDISASEFVPIPGSGTTLRMTNVEKKHAGRYKCVAQNSLGSDEHVTSLIVEYSPVITSTTNSTTVEGIEGDLALRIPCDVIGVPKPVITWKLKGAIITPDAKYSVEDGALVIMNPTEKDTSAYTCEAKNHISSVNVTFQAKVDKLPKNFGKIHHVYLKKGETRKLECPAYNSTSQTVKWFITRNITQLSTTTSRPDHESSTPSSRDASMSRTITQDAGNKKYIQISNASLFEHDGNYTCHVSDKHGNTQTHTYVVDVGVAPVFVSDANSIRNWRGDITVIKQNCDSNYNTKPMPVVQWTFNGKALSDLSSAGVGHYTCNVSNVHGSVQKQFDVTSSVCLITRNSRDAEYMPLVLNDEGSWHNLETTDYYMIVQQESMITLSCAIQKGTSNTFRNFPKNNKLEAICYKEDSFLVEGKIYKLSDLKCTSNIQPSVIKRKVKCSTETSELISVGYNVPGYLEAYEVCFDHNMNMPLYSRIIMTDANNNGLNTGYNWFAYPGIGFKQNEKAFTCKDASSSCCYSKSQLVNSIDFNDGPAKKSTFIDPLNVIPVWIPCDTSKWSWEVVNDNVRSMLPLYETIAVWSGTHTVQKKNGAAIPRYLWKVVRLADDEVLAIVHVNGPDPTESDIKCKSPSICNKYEDWTANGSSTYCCSLPDFFKAFNIHISDIGESMATVLDKIKST